MADFSTIKEEIDARITTNGNQEITGAILNDVLNDMVDGINEAIEPLENDGYLYAGVVTPTSAAPTATGKVFVLASTAGTYTNFGNLVVNEGEVAILKFDGEDWSKDVTEIASQVKLSELEGKVSELEQSNFVKRVIFEDNYFSTGTTPIFSKYRLKADEEIDIYIKTEFLSSKDLQIYNNIGGAWDSLIVPITKEEAYEGKHILYKANQNGTLCIRANDYGVSYVLKVSKFFVNGVDIIPNEIVTPKDTFNGTISATTPQTTNLILKASKVYRLYVKTSGTLSVADNISKGLYKKVDSSFVNIYGISNASFSGGAIIPYIPTEDTELYVRTMESGVAISIEVSEVKLVNELEEIRESIATLEDAMIKKDIQEGNGTINATTPMDVGLRIYAGKENKIYVKIIGTISNAYDLGLWTKINNAWVHFHTPTATEFNNGIEITYTPIKDCYLYVRTLVAGVQYQARVTNEHPITEVIDHLPKHTLRNKVVAFYGDSITAITNGDFTYPFGNDATSVWGEKVGKHYEFAKVFGRGIGGQKYAYGVLGNGGSVSWVTPQGNLIARNENFTYDNFDGSSYPSGVTKAMEDAGTAIRTKGAFSSWKRITDMFPPSIKDTIEIVCIMGGTNDVESTSANDFQFIPNSNIDTEWASSSYYSQYGGDYNIDTLKGGIASTIMKFQAWMPNAKIVIMTPLSGRGTQGQKNLQLLTQEYTKTTEIKKMANILSIPIVDVNSICGINGFNRTSYITDNLHPYSQNGQKMLANAVVCGLVSIVIM